MENIVIICNSLHFFAQVYAQAFLFVLVSVECLNGCAVGDHQLWQDVRLILTKSEESWSSDFVRINVFLKGEARHSWICSSI